MNSEERRERQRLLQESEKGFEKGRRERKITFPRDSEPVKRALERHGITVEDLSDVLDARYVPLSKEVIDTLLEQVQLVDNVDVQEWVVRLIGATRVPYDARALADLFDRSTDHFVKWVIGNTLSITAPLNVEQWLPGALQDSRHGTSREMLCVAIARVVPEQARTVLKEVFEELTGHAAMGLGKCGGLEEAEFLREKAASATTWRTWEKNEVKKAIKQIEKRAAKHESKGDHSKRGLKNR